MHFQIKNSIFLWHFSIALISKFSVLFSYLQQILLNQTIYVFFIFILIWYKSTQITDQIKSFSYTFLFIEQKFHCWANEIEISSAVLGFRKARDIFYYNCMLYVIQVAPLLSTLGWRKSHLFIAIGHEFHLVPWKLPVFQVVQ